MNSAGDQGRSGPSAWLGVILRLLITLLFVVLLLFLSSCGLRAQPGTATPTSVAATAYLIVEVAPRGAEIYVDGMRSGSTPATLTLRPGQHTIRVEQDGFEALVEKVNLAADDEATISGELIPLRETPIPTVTLIAPGESDSGQPLPDLAITYVQVDLETGGSCEYTSTALGVRLWIENLGNVDADAFVVEVNGIQQVIAGGLEAGQTVTLWFAGYVADGENIASVDATSQVQESREDNNTFAQRLPIPTLPPTCTPPAGQSSAATVASKTAEPPDVLPTATQPPTPLPVAVTMRESQVTIPTYPYADFTSEAWSETFNMPYAVLNRAAYEASNPAPAGAVYRTFIVENEVIALTFLPDLGGRLYKVLYKPTGHLVTYRNPVLKPSPWGPPEQGWWLAAGGFEWCLPVEEHGYEWNVPWKLSATGDGQSATVTLRDVSSGDRVQAEIAVRLEAGAGYFTIRPRLENPTGAPLEVKYWTNAMLAPGGQNKPSADLRFVLPEPVTNVTIHSRGDEFLPDNNQRVPWPVVDGTDLSRLGNWNRWLGFFEDPAAGDFVAAYDEGYDEGIVRVYSADAVPGSKVFAFGWQDPISWSNWTDDGSSYVELHSGPAPTFDDSVTIPAGGSLQWTEIWYPVAGMGGLRCADETAAMNLSAGSGQAHVAVAVPRGWSGDSVLLVNGQERWRETVSLQPGQSFLATAELGSDAPATGRLTLRLEASDGTVLSKCSAELDLK
jgi:hypothetical protein